MSADTTGTMNQSVTAYIPGHHGSQPQSRFLQLPGEIRNIVYNYVSDDCVVYLRDERQFRSYSSVKVAIPWATLKRQGLGLTQVCRQIRHEILPLYRHRVRPLFTHLPSSEIFHYIHSVFPDPARTLGTLVLWYHRSSSAFAYIDLMPVIRLATSARDLKLEFIVGLPHPHLLDYDKNYITDKVDILNKFFDPSNKGGMRRAMEICESIRFGFEHFCHKTSLEVRAEYAEIWMPARHGFGQENEPEALDWLREIGLVQDAMEHFQRDLVVIETEEMWSLSW